MLAWSSMSLRTISPNALLRSIAPGDRAKIWALVLLAASGSAAFPGRAHAESPSIGVRVADPPAVAYDALGRSTHPIRIAIQNTSGHALGVTPLAFRLRATRDGIAFPCDDLAGNDDRWPAVLDPRETIHLSRDVTCQTPLPGHYDVELLGRPRGSADAEERSYASFSLHIEPGANPPVPLPWTPGPTLLAAASGTKEMRPSRDPDLAKIVIGVINGGRTATTLSPMRATLRVSRRGTAVAPCAERSVDVAFSGPLAPGKVKAITLPLGCNLSAEAIYDVTVHLATSVGRVRIATQAIRVGVLPPPPPRPDDVTGPPGKVIGGM